jgi:hypothetical protein
MDGLGDTDCDSGPRQLPFTNYRDDGDVMLRRVDASKCLQRHRCSCIEDRYLPLRVPTIEVLGMVNSERLESDRSCALSQELMLAKVRRGGSCDTERLL